MQYTHSYASGVKLVAGSLSATLEAGGGLRHIAWCGRAVVSRLYAAVRDSDWSTVTPQLSDLRVDQSADEFRVRFLSTHRESDIDFEWRAEIVGTSQGYLSYSFAGQSRSDFLSNRIGFCLLHSMDRAGARCRIRHSNGSITQSQLPVSISPRQPFFDIASIGLDVGDGIWVETSFNGESFEMEDQRNWSDASFKTYCRPLSKPYPYLVSKGSEVRQSATIEVIGNAPAIPTWEQRVRLQPDLAQHLPFPNVGVELSPDQPAPNAEEVSALQSLHLSHLRVDLSPSDTAFDEAVRKAVDMSKELNIPLLVALYLSNKPRMELELTALHLGPHSSVVDEWLILSTNAGVTPKDVFSLAQNVLGPLNPHARFCAGTDHNFAELNRGVAELPCSESVCYSINPQVHAFDDESLFETLAAQYETVRSALALCPDTRVVVSPVTLLPRRNAVKTSAVDDFEPRPADSRQNLPLTAAWAVGSLKYLAEAGAAVVTLFETTGYRGLMDDQGAFPVYHALFDILAFQPESIYVSTSSDASRVLGFCLRRGTSLRMVATNLTPEPQHVSVEILRDGNAHGGFEERTINPYRIALFDWDASDSEDLTCRQ